MGMGNGGGVIEVYDKMAVGCNLVNQRVQRTVLNDFTLVDDNNPLAQLLDIAQVVGGQDNGGLAALIDLLDELPDGVFRLHIQTDGGLVQKQDLRRMEHGRHQIAPHPLTKRELPHRGVDKTVDLKNLIEHSQIIGIGSIINLVNTFQQLKSFTQPQVPVQLAALSEHHTQIPYHPFAVPLGRDAVDQDLAAGGPHDAAKHLHCGAFSRTIGTYVAHDVPLFDGKGDVVHRPDILRLLHKEVFHRAPQSSLFFDFFVFLHQMADFNDVHGCASPPLIHCRFCIRCSVSIRSTRISRHDPLEINAARLFRLDPAQNLFHLFRIALVPLEGMKGPPPERPQIPVKQWRGLFLCLCKIIAVFH